MNLKESLLAEVAGEARTTRKHLERLSDEYLAWRPHAKSFTAGELTSHIVECFWWGEIIFRGGEYHYESGKHQHYQASSVGDLLKRFDENVTACQDALVNVAEIELGQIWRLKVKGRTVVERDKAAAFRDFTLSHLIHHRGQFSVYLRLLDIAVPGSYGPTADEQF